MIEVVGLIAEQAANQFAAFILAMFFIAAIIGGVLAHDL